MTFFAPEDRAPADQIHQEAARLLRLPLVVQLLDTLPLQVAVINRQYQIVHANRALVAGTGLEHLEKLLGRRTGEALGCIHARERPSGCGTTEACRFCGAINAIREADRDQRETEREFRLTVTGDDGVAESREYRVRVSPLPLDQERFFVLSLTDISAEKRRRVLERLFFHDIINAAGGIQGLAEVFALSDNQAEMKQLMQDMRTISSLLLDAIIAQRELSAAEAGELQPVLEPVSLAGALHDARQFLAHHEVARGRQIQSGSFESLVMVRADRNLLRRILVNMLKNALEASPAAGVVRIRPAPVREGYAGLSVANDGVMPPEVQLQLFQRSFSTKGANRGLGTYSMKLFAEHYLGGRLEFHSAEPEGTVFTLYLPLALSAAGPRPGTV